MMADENRRLGEECSGSRENEKPTCVLHWGSSLRSFYMTFGKENFLDSLVEKVSV